MRTDPKKSAMYCDLYLHGDLAHYKWAHTTSEDQRQTTKRSAARETMEIIKIHDAIINSLKS